jgi:ribose 5-phosphate isomerase B
VVSTIALGADHAGYGLKEALKGWLINHNYQVLDLGTHSTESVDYPDYAALVAESVVDHKVERGLLVCGTRIGMSIGANKVSCFNDTASTEIYTARMSREHNDANVLVLGGRLMGADMAADILQAWLETDFAAGRHARRVAKIADVESRHAGDGAHP